MRKEKIVFIISLITMIISSIISVYAANYLYNSNEVSYNNTSSGITSDNVQGAIDELYTEATNYNTLSTKVGSDTLTTTAQNLSGAVNELNSKTTISNNWIDATISGGFLSPSYVKYKRFGNVVYVIFRIHLPSDNVTVNAGSNLVDVTCNNMPLPLDSPDGNDATITGATYYDNQIIGIRFHGSNNPSPKVLRLRASASTKRTGQYISGAFTYLTS